MVDTEAKTITAIGTRTVEEILELRRVLANLNKKLDKDNRYTLEFGGEPSDFAFNAFSPPNAEGNDPHFRKRRIGFKQGKDETR